MKKLCLIAIGLLAAALAGPARAADLPVKAPPPPAPPPVYSWTGFYIGANGGWGSARHCWDFVVLDGPVFTDGCRHRSGGVAGGQIGYRWQTAQFVFGLEAQGDWADIRHDRTSVFNPLLTLHSELNAIGLFTGQIGWAPWSATLLYVKGGAAVTNSDFDVNATFTGVNLASASATRWGGTVGAGVEYGFAPNWSAGVEYMHLFMGHSDNSFTTFDPLLVGALSNRIRQDVDMVTVRVNWRIGPWGGPLNW